MSTRRRLDPPSNPTDGYRPYDKITNKQPDRHYVLTYPNDQESGTPYYTDILGYEVETVRPGGPRAAIGKTAKDGSEVRSGGMVLVSCPLAEYEARFRAGQVHADNFDRRALRDGNVDDPMRGRGYNYRAHVTGSLPDTEGV